MANNVDLVLRLLAEDKASAAFKKVGSEVDATGSKYGKFAKRAATALAAVGVVKFAKDSVKAYAEAEQSQAKLEQAYRKFPKTANLSIEALREYNSELQTKTKYDDDDTAAMQAHLAMFNLTGQQIKTLTPLVQDLAAAQGIDLASAGDAVGKALMGNAKALKAIGVNFKATGDSAKDYAAIQQILNQQVGGFAENEGKTAAGQAAILANQFGDLQESVGAALVPALQSMVNVLTPITKAFNGLPQPVKTTAVVVGAAGAAFLYLTPKILAARAAVTQFGIASRLSGTHVKGFGKAVGVMTVALTAASVANNTMSESTTNVDDALSLLAGNHATDQIGTDLAHLFGATTKMDDAAAALDGMDSKLAEMVTNGHAEEARVQYEKMRKSFADMGGEMSIFDAHFSSYTDAVSKGTDTTQQFSGAMTTAAKETRSAAWAVDYYKKRLDVLNNKNLDSKQRALQFKDSLEDLKKQIKENGRSLDENTAKGRKNVETLLDLIQSTNDDAKAQLDAGASYDSVKARHDKQIESLRTLASKLGLNKTAVDKLVDAYGKMPAKVTTVIVAQGATSALTTLQKINSEIRKLPGHSGVAVAVSGGDLVAHGTSGRTTTTKSIVPSTSRSASSSVPLVVNTVIDGRAIAQTQVTLKRANGGSLPYLN